MEVKKVSYSFVNMMVFMIAIIFTGYTIKPIILSILVIVSSLILIISSLILVKRYAPKTFKLN